MCFTCLFSVVFLHREQKYFQYIGVFLVTVGMFLVGLSLDAKITSYLGLFICILAQAFKAAYMVMEEGAITAGFPRKEDKPRPMAVAGVEGLLIMPCNI